MTDPDGLTKEEVEQRARELARRVMSKPYQKQEWPRQPKPGGIGKKNKIAPDQAQPGDTKGGGARERRQKEKGG